MIPECFENYIGTSKDCESESRSGYYLTDLAGITLETAASIVGGEQIRGKDLLKSCVDMAINLTMSDLGTHTKKFFNYSSIVDNVTSGIFNSTYLPPVPFKRGIVFRKRRTNMQRLSIKSLEILVNTNAVNKEIEIEDYFYPTPPVVGQVPYVTTKIVIPKLEAGKILTVPINYVAKGDEVRILMNDVNISVNEGSYGNSYFSGGCCGGSQNQATVTDLEVSGWNGIGYESRTFGFKATAVIECDETSLFCLIKDKITFLFMYKAGIEFAKKWLYSDRLSKETVYELERSKASSLLKLFEDEYKTRYESAAKSLRSWIGNYDCKCVSCTGYSFGFIV